MTIPEYDEPPLSYLSPVKPGKYPHGAGETVTGKKWCAWCGVWGDHTSGSCDDLKMNELAKLKESQTFLRRVLASVLLQRHGGQTTVDLKNGWLSTDSRFEPVIVTYTNDDGRNLAVSVKNTTEPRKREETG